MPTVSQGTLRADAAEPTTPSEGPGLMPWRWDTSRGGKIPPLPAPASATLEVPGHRSLRRQYTPPGWQPAALLRLLGTLLTLGVSMSPAAALQDAPESGGALTTPSPPQCPARVEKKSCPGELLSRNQSRLAPLPPPVSMQCPALQAEPAPTAGPSTGADPAGLRPLLATAVVLASLWAMRGRSNGVPASPKPACFIGRRRLRRLREKRRSTSGPPSHRMRGAVLLFLFAGHSVYGMTAGGTPLGSTNRWGGVCRRVCQQKCTAALQESVEAPGPPPNASPGKFKSPHGYDGLVKLLLERSAELEAAKAALVRQDRELADVREKLASKDRQLTDMNVTLLASLAHLSEAQDMATKCGRAAKRGGFAPATPEHQETSTGLAVASIGFRTLREGAKSAARWAEEGTRNAVARRDRRLERGRRLADCAWIGSIPTDGTWFEVEASCDFRKAKSGGGYEPNTVVVGPGQVVRGEERLAGGLQPAGQVPHLTLDHERSGLDPRIQWNIL